MPKVRAAYFLRRRSKRKKKHGVKYQYRYPCMPIIFSINIVNTGNIGSNISQYYRVNIVSCTLKPDTILSIYRSRPIFETMNKKREVIITAQYWCVFIVITKKQKKKTEKSKCNTKKREMNIFIYT